MNGYNFMQLYWVIRSRSHSIRRVFNLKSLENLIFLNSLDDSDRAIAESVAIAIILDDDLLIIDRFYKELSKNPIENYDLKNEKLTKEDFFNIIKYASRDLNSLIFNLNQVINSKRFLNGLMKKGNSEND